MAGTGAGCTLKRFAIEAFPIGELLDDPITQLLMSSDAVDRQAVERFLLAATIVRPIAIPL